MEFEKAIYPSLRGRRVIITGGASGIGASIVQHFAEQGSQVVFLDLDQVAGEALAATSGTQFEACDLRDIGALRTVLARYEKPAVLVNNAANDMRHSIESVEPESWDRGMEVNLRHQFFAAQAVAEQMKVMGGGSIINMGSVCWHWKTAQMVAYMTAKAGVRGLTRALARDLGTFGIRVNEVMPGWIFTERQETLWATPEAVEATMKQQCIPEKVRAEDVARMVLWLAADDSRLISGQSFYVDAGGT